MRAASESFGLPEKEGSLLEALQIQLRVIGALILREIKTRFWRNRLGYLWAFGEPCVHLAAWLAIRTFLRHPAETAGMGSVLFLSTGLLPMFMFRKVGMLLGSSISANRSLLSYPLVKNIDVIIARFILEATTNIVVSCLVFGVLILDGQALPPKDFLGLFLPTALLLLLGLGFGGINAVLTILSPMYDSFLSIIYRIVYFTSGVFFLAGNLPPQVLKYLWWNPVLHGIDLFRSAWSPVYQTDFASPGYMLLCGLSLLLIALALERVARAKLQELA